jgi:hypothetical protein
LKPNSLLRNFLSFLVLGLLLIVGTDVAAQNEKSFVGDWRGAVYIGGVEIELVFHFNLDDSGNLTGTIDSPSQGAFDMALADIKVEGKKISFGVDDPNVSGDPRFDGTLDETGTKISGDFSQDGGEGTFELKKE